MGRALAIFLSDDSIYEDVRVAEGAMCTFVITGQVSGRDDHVLAEAMAENKRVHIFHRRRAVDHFWHYGAVNFFGSCVHRSVPVGVMAAADQQMRQVVYTSNKPVRVPMMAEPTTRMRFKESAVALVGRMAPETNLNICFVVVDVPGGGGGGGDGAPGGASYETAFMPLGATDRSIDLDAYVETQKVKEETRNEKKARKKEAKCSKEGCA